MFPGRRITTAWRTAWPSFFSRIRVACRWLINGTFGIFAVITVCTKSQVFVAILLTHKIVPGSRGFENRKLKISESKGKKNAWKKIELGVVVVSSCVTAFFDERVCVFVSW